MLWSLLLLSALPRPAAIDEALGNKLILAEASVTRAPFTLWHFQLEASEPAFFLVDSSGRLAPVVGSCSLSGPLEEHSGGWHIRDGETLGDCQLVVERSTLKIVERRWYEARPEFARQLARSVKLASAAQLLLLPVEGGRIVVLLPNEKLWVVDASTGALDAALTEEANRTLADSSYGGCRQYGQRPLLSEDFDMHCGDGGTALMDYFCRFGGSAIPECGEEVGRKYSLGQLNDPDVQQEMADSACASESRRIAELTEAVSVTKRLLETNAWAAALQQFRSSLQSLAVLPETRDESCGSTDDTVVHRSVDLWAEYLNNFGYALERAGDFRQALIILERTEAFVTSAGRTRPVVWLNLGEVRCAVGDKAGARGDLERFLASPITRHQRNVARALLRKCQP